MNGTRVDHAPVGQAPALHLRAIVRRHLWRKWVHAMEASRAGRWLAIGFGSALYGCMRALGPA